MKNNPSSQLRSAQSFIFLSFAFLLNSFALPVQAAQGPDKLRTTINEEGVKLKENDIVLVVGTIGCGKSTLIAAMNNEMTLDDEKREVAVKPGTDTDVPEIAKVNFVPKLTTKECKLYKDSSGIQFCDTRGFYSDCSIEQLRALAIHRSIYQPLKQDKKPSGPQPSEQNNKSARQIYAMLEQQSIAGIILTCTLTEFGTPSSALEMIERIVRWFPDASTISKIKPSVCLAITKTKGRDYSKEEFLDNMLCVVKYVYDEIDSQNMEELEQWKKIQAFFNLFLKPGAGTKTEKGVSFDRDEDLDETNIIFFDPLLKGKRNGKCIDALRDCVLHFEGIDKSSLSLSQDDPALSSPKEQATLNSSPEIGRVSCVKDIDDEYYGKQTGHIQWAMQVGIAVSFLLCLVYLGYKMVRNGKMNLGNLKFHESNSLTLQNVKKTF